MLGWVVRSACSCAAASAATAVARHDCCVVVVDLVVAVAVTLVFAVASDFCAAAAVAAVVARHAGFSFFFKHQADVSSTGRIWWEIAHLGWHRPLVVNVNFAGNLVVAAKNLGGALHPWLAPSIAWKCSLLLGS